MRRQAFLRLGLRLARVFLVPGLGRWAEEWAERGASLGVALDHDRRALASAAGVRDSAGVRVVVVDDLPPLRGALRRLAPLVGFAELDALTLGGTIFIRRGRTLTRALIAHELRHVAQYEHAGSVARFLREYVRQLVVYGYERAPLEVDAQRASRMLA